jgi:VanZ family protein
LFSAQLIKRTVRRNEEKQKRSTLQRVRRYGPLLLWIVFISFASGNEFSALNTSTIVRPLVLWFFPNISEDRLTAIHFLIRKAAHLTEYGVLAFLASRAFSTSSHAFIRRHLFQLGLLLVVGYSLLDEFHQSFVPSRTASLYDSVIDMAGGVSVLLIFKLYYKRTKNREVHGY